MALDAHGFAQAAMEAWSRRDADTFNSLVDPEFEVESWLIAGVEGQGTFRGLAGGRRFVEAIDGVFEDFQPTVTAVRDLGERWMFEMDVRVRGRGSGIETQMRTFHVVELRDGRPVRWRMFRDRAEALAAAGLTEDDLA